MINTLYTQIQQQEQATFDELFRKNSATIPTKPELGALLRTLENEKKIFQFGGSYYDLNKFPDVEGFVQWKLTGFCWLSDTNDMNEWGITFNPNDSLLSIYNKRDAHYGHYVQGKKVAIEDKEFVFVTSTELKQEAKLIATYQELRKEWVVLNSGTGFTFRDKLSTTEHGQVAIFNSKDNELIEVIGNMKDSGIESKIITLLANIETAPKSTFTEVKTDKLKKTDKPFYTIDSLNTKDIDDAIWIEETPNGFHLLVAIADVSSYVLPNDIQDKHAQKTCSSFYLPHDTIHMLDRQLAENFCSLNPGVTKQAMICDMVFDKEGQMQSKDFYPSEIISHARLTYSDVDKMIENINPEESILYKNGTTQKLTQVDDSKEILNSLNTLYKFSQTQKRTSEKLYWVVEQSEYYLGEDGKIDHLYAKEESAPSQQMVESAMLAANISAAEFLYEKYPQFGMFRNQFEPPKDEFPKPAFYDFTNEGHWGLNTKFYTHFTSPIRRYCDLLVHRLIKNVISQDVKLYNNEELGEMAQQINLQQYKSKQFNIKSKNLLVPQYVEKLLATNQFDEKLEFVDFSENGVVCRNKQLIEIFIPSFKLEKDITRALEKILPKEDEEITVEQKRNSLATLNQEWTIYTKISNFVWTDERKNAFYQINRKPRNIKPNTI